MAEKISGTTRDCQCPYCDEEVREQLAPICRACGTVITYCPGCNLPVSKETGVCPKCGKVSKK